MWIEKKNQTLKESRDFNGGEQKPKFNNDSVQL